MSYVARFFRRLISSKPRHYSTNSVTGANNHPSTFINHVSNFPKPFTLAEFKQNPTQYTPLNAPDQRKYFAMDVIGEISYEKEMGNHRGSLALHHITVKNSNARIPCASKIYNPMVHKNYIEGYKDFFNDLYSGNEPLDDPYYVDIKSYVQDLKTLDQLLLIHRHPYFQHTTQALKFIPSALKILTKLKGRKLPLLYTGTTLSPEIPHDGEVLYRDLRGNGDEVNITKSISGLSSNKKKAFEAIYDQETYSNNDPIDELYFYARVSSRHSKEHKVPGGNAGKVKALSEALSPVPITMFKFLSIYNGCFGGLIHLDFVSTLGVSLRLESLR